MTSGDDIETRTRRRLAMLLAVVCLLLVFLATRNDRSAEVEPVAASESPSPTPLPAPASTTSRPPSGAITVSVRDHGAHGDGVHDDRQAVAAAAAAAGRGGAVYFPKGHYLLAGSLDVPAGVRFFSDAGAVLLCQGAVRAGSRSSLEGLTFKSQGGKIGVSIGSSSSMARRVTVRDCSFIGGSTEFQWARIIIWRGQDCIIDHNTLTGSSGSGSNIWVVGGKRNLVTDNTITGGKTAILFMWSMRANGGGPGSIIEDNIVTGNVYSGYSEEGISFDLMANSGDTGAREYDVVRAVDGQTITLSSLAFPDYVGYDVVFVDGALRGRTRTVTAQSGNSFTVAGSLAGVAVGDHVTIGACYKQNYIARNTGTSAEGSDPFAAILLYGLCFGNTIEENTIVRGKIKVQSLDYVAVADRSATGTFGRAPCGYNTIRGNVIQAASGNIYLQYHSLGGDYSPFISEGNNVIGNVTPLVEAEYQSAYIVGNSGATRLRSVRLAGSPYTYDGR